jgi:hypothetical protein
MRTKILFHAINGTGLGHVVRLAWIAQALRASGQPFQCAVVSTSSHAQTYFRTRCHDVACDLRLPATHAEQVWGQVRRSRPAAVVFDTRWPDGLPELLGTRRVRRILVLRALSPERMERAVFAAGECFDEVLLPHTRHELAYLFGEDTPLAARLRQAPFLAVGPLARVSAAPSASSAVLFSVGAGGEYLGNVTPENQVRTQLANYREAARLLRARGYRDLRLLAGPLLEDVDPEGPWQVIRDLDAHALVGPRSTVVGRGGYNTAWEVIGVGGHLVLCSSHRIAEDVERRCRYLEACEMARFTAGAPQEIAEAVVRGHAPNVEAGRRLVNAGLREVVRAILG